MKWDVIYERAIRDDNSLFFPERLTHEFLANMRQTMGSYLFANQYLNEVLPSDKMVFKREWVKYYSHLPERTHTFAFVDPAISTSDSADYTAIVVVKVDEMNTRYVVHAERIKALPSDLCSRLFEINNEYKPMRIGIETVAYQKALLYILDSESKRRGQMLPIAGVNPGTDKTKEMRILALVPYFEWGRLFLKQGLTELEDELFSFPRSRHDDLIDALASIDTILIKPNPERTIPHEPHPQSPEYEREYLKRLIKRANQGDSEY